MYIILYYSIAYSNHTIFLSFSNTLYLVTQFLRSVYSPRRSALELNTTSVVGSIYNNNNNNNNNNNVQLKHTCEFCSFNLQKFLLSLAFYSIIN